MNNSAWIGSRRAALVTKPSHAKIARLFDASLMSDRKWHKLFGMLERPDVELRQAIIKFIDTEHQRVMQMPTSADLRGSSYIELDCGPVALLDIEWLELPQTAIWSRTSPTGTGTIPPHRAKQPLDKVRALLDRVGRFPLLDTERGLRIVGHVRRHRDCP